MCPGKRSRRDRRIVWHVRVMCRSLRDTRRYRLSALVQLQVEICKARAASHGRASLCGSASRAISPISSTSSCTRRSESSHHRSCRALRPSPTRHTHLREIQKGVARAGSYGHEGLCGTALRLSVAPVSWNLWRVWRSELSLRRSRRALRPSSTRHVDRVRRGGGLGQRPRGLVTSRIEGRASHRPLHDNWGDRRAMHARQPHSASPPPRGVDVS